MRPCSGGLHVYLTHTHTHTHTHNRTPSSPGCAPPRPCSGELHAYLTHTHTHTLMQPRPCSGGAARIPLTHRPPTPHTRTQPRPCSGGAARIPLTRTHTLSRDHAQVGCTHTSHTHPYLTHAHCRDRAQVVLHAYLTQTHTSHTNTHTDPSSLGYAPLRPCSGELRAYLTHTHTHRRDRA